MGTWQRPGEYSSPSPSNVSLVPVFHPGISGTSSTFSSGRFSVRFFRFSMKCCGFPQNRSSC